MAVKFGEFLQVFRVRAGLSQRALAALAEIDTSYVSRLERGEREVTSRELALKLAEIFRLSADETDVWLLSAGYASPRLQRLEEGRISKLMDEITGPKRPPRTRPS